MNQENINKHMKELIAYTRDNPDKFQVQKRCQEILFTNREYGKKHNAYEREAREFQAVEAGNAELLTQALLENLGGDIGTLSKDSIRNQKDLSIVVITLACRAAIRGGMDPELAFTMSDSYIQILEELPDQMQIGLLACEAEFTYTEAVAAAKRMNRDSNSKKNVSFLRKEENIHVRHCKEYIYLHLHDRINIQEVANELGLNASYLSKLFHEEEGMTVKQFIKQEKINLAQNMLTYSPYTYSEIANYLGFSSQSHLGEQFRQVTGVTMACFRRENS